MKAIMISIKPEWVAKILNGEKTIEIRKTMPKCELPIKCYIYCTKAGNAYFCSKKVREFANKGFCGSVVAEFTLNKITKHEKNYIDAEDNLCYNFLSEDVKKAGFTFDDKNAVGSINALCEFDLFVESYGQGKPLYAWHIEDLKIYDKPKKLSNFSAFIPNNECNKDCLKCNAYSKEYDTCLIGMNLCKILIKAPQSWRYVKEIENDNA